MGIPACGGGLDDGVDALVGADVAGVDAELRGPSASGLDGQRVIEVDVGDDRKRRGGGDRFEALEGVCARDRDAHDLAARVGEATDLGEGGLGVARVGVGHRLHDDGCAPAYRDGADHDRTRIATLFHHQLLSGRTGRAPREAPRRPSFEPRSA